MGGIRDWFKPKKEIATASDIYSNSNAIPHNQEAEWQRILAENNSSYDSEPLPVPPVNVEDIYHSDNFLPAVQDSAPENTHYSYLSPYEDIDTMIDESDSTVAQQQMRIDPGQPTSDWRMPLLLNLMNRIPKKQYGGPIQKYQHGDEIPEAQTVDQSAHQDVWKSPNVSAVRTPLGYGYGYRRQRQPSKYGNWVTDDAVKWLWGKGKEAGKGLIGAGREALSNRATAREGRRAFEETLRLEQEAFDRSKRGEGGIYTDESRKEASWTPMGNKKVTGVHPKLSGSEYQDQPEAVDIDAWWEKRKQDQQLNESLQPFTTPEGRHGPAPTESELQWQLINQKKDYDESRSDLPYQREAGQEAYESKINELTSPKDIKWGEGSSYPAANLRSDIPLLNAEMNLGIRKSDPSVNPMGPHGVANVGTTDDSGHDVRKSFIDKKMGSRTFNLERSGIPSWDDMTVVSPELSKILEKHNITNPRDIKKIQDLQAKQAVADQGVVDADQHYRQIAPSFISGELERRRIEDADSAIAAAKNALGSDDPAIMQQGGPLLQEGMNQAINNERTMRMRKFVADVNQQSPMFLDTILSRT